MKTPDRSIAHTRISNVYLADLHKLLSIYGSRPLTVDFGLPLALAEDDDETIGYAYAIFEPSGNPQFRTLFKPGIETGETKRQLLARAHQVFDSVYVVEGRDLSSLKGHVERLTYWLGLRTKANSQLLPHNTRTEKQTLASALS